MLELLALVVDDGGLRIVFAGGAEIRLAIDGVRCHLRDFGEPWPVFGRPRHRLEDDAEAC